jgi:hypothetical protein
MYESTGEDSYCSSVHTAMSNRLSSFPNVASENLELWLIVAQEGPQVSEQVSEDFVNSVKIGVFKQ